MKKTFVDKNGVLIEDKNLKKSEIINNYTPVAPTKLISEPISTGKYFDVYQKPGGSPSNKLTPQRHQKKLSFAISHLSSPLNLNSKYKSVS